VAGFDVGNGETLFVNGSQEVGPEEFDVVAVGLLELGVFVNGFVALGGVEGPAVLPTDVEGALGAVEVDAELMLFGGGAGELAVFPGAGEFFEVVDDDLVVGGVGWSCGCRH